jgi:hypothetical protein
VRSSGSTAVRLVDVDDHVELVGDARVEVVRDALGLGTVDDADAMCWSRRFQLWTPPRNIER